MGVPPEKVADVMALMGDSIDNIPGAKGIGEKGARELIRRFGSAEAALDRAAEVEGKRYREALQNSREQVLLSKQLAMIAADAPVKLDLDELTRREPDFEALRASLRRTRIHFAAARSARSRHGLHRRHRLRRARFARRAAKLSAARSRAEPKSPCGSRSMPANAKPKASARASPAFEISPQPGVSRSAWCDEEGRNARRAARISAPTQRGPKSCTIRSSSSCSQAPSRGIRHATMLYSYLAAAHHREARPRRRRLAPSNVTLSGAPGERADHLQRLAPLLAQGSRSAGPRRTSTRRSICRSRPCSPRWSATACASIPRALAAMSATMEREIRALESSIWELAGCGIQRQFAAAARRNSLRQDESRRSAASAAARKLALDRRRRARRAGAPARIAAQSAGIPRTHQAQIHLRGRAAETDRPRHRPPAHAASARPARPPAGSAPRIRICKIFPCAPNSAARFAPRSSPSPADTLLSADYSQIELRILAHFSEDPVLRRSVPHRPGHSRAHRAGSFRRRPAWRKPPSTAAPPRPSTSASSTAYRRSASRNTRHRAKRSRAIHRRLFRALSAA